MDRRLVDKKTIHVAVTKDVHTALRHISFDKQVSIQEILCEFATELAEGSASLNRIVENIVKRKAREKIEGLGGKFSDKLYKSKISVNSQEALFEIIEKLNPIQHDELAVVEDGDE